MRIDVGDSYDQDFDLSFNDALNASGNFNLTGTSTPLSFRPDVATWNVGNASVNQVAKTFSQVMGDSGNAIGFNRVDGGFYEFFSRYVTAKISLLEKNNQAEIVAKPVMLASNNRPARLFIGSEQVVPVSIETNTKFSAANNNGDRTSSTTTTLETERRKIGNTLILMPSVNADRTVTIDIFQDTSSIQKNGLNFPIFNSTTNSIDTVLLDAVQESNVKTVVVAKDGKTIALGGMINSENSDVETVVPLLGRIPLIGEMFKSKEERDITSQYVMLITPHVLMSPEEGGEKSSQVAEFRDELEGVDSESQRKAFGVSDYIRLTRFAARTGFGDLTVERPANLKDVPITQAPLSFVFNNPKLSVWPVSSWEREGLYVTLLKARNHSDQPQVLDMASIPGAWLAASADRMQLSVFGADGDQSQLYLLSNRPFHKVIESVNLAGGVR